MNLIRWAARAAGLALMLSALASAAMAGASPPVPEIDPSSVLSAFTLLGGGLLLLKDRRRGK